ncbi:hypothetical protein ABH994_001003 [Bradyrhizobium yuanmingense]
MRESQAASAASPGAAFPKSGDCRLGGARNENCGPIHPKYVEKLVGSGTPVIATVTGVGYKLALSERL